MGIFGKKKRKTPPAEQLKHIERAKTEKRKLVEFLEDKECTFQTLISSHGKRQDGWITEYGWDLTHYPKYYHLGCTLTQSSYRTTQKCDITKCPIFIKSGLQSSARKETQE